MSEQTAGGRFLVVALPQPSFFGRLGLALLFGPIVGAFFHAVFRQREVWTLSWLAAGGCTVMFFVSLWIHRRKRRG